jgi:hypothetical protein
MGKLTKEQFQNMNLKDVAEYHGVKELDFIEQCYPSEKYIWDSLYFYNHYEEWYRKTQNKLAKALK